jgi:hypothetical protein
MNTINDVRQGLEKRWEGHRVLDLCRTLIGKVEDIGPKDAKHLSLGRLSEMVKKQAVDEELLLALTILSGSEPPLLNVAALFHDGAEEFDLDPEEIDNLLTTDTLVHPHTGKLVLHASEKTSIYYTVSDEICERDG